ncbi:hypothetical protein KAI10_09515, partial [Candidatus Bathyarchaeota archaeon]|nr:hypothetical protein [Candidatus Bathyarchaeota archaeon]
KTVIETNSTAQETVAANLPGIASEYFGVGGPLDFDEYGTGYSLSTITGNTDLSMVQFRR